MQLDSQIGKTTRLRKFRKWVRASINMHAHIEQVFSTENCYCLQTFPKINATLMASSIRNQARNRV